MKWDRLSQKEEAVEDKINEIRKKDEIHSILGDEVLADGGH